MANANKQSKFKSFIPTNDFFTPWEIRRNMFSQDCSISLHLCPEFNTVTIFTNFMNFHFTLQDLQNSAYSTIFPIVNCSMEIYHFCAVLFLIIQALASSRLADVTKLQNLRPLANLTIFWYTVAKFTISCSFN